MAYTLEQFATDIRATLSADSGPGGREAVRALVERVLRDEEFIATYVPQELPQERNVLHEDTELGFCICAHNYRGAKRGKPHDHGPTWAIYGQADGETEMTDWRVVSPAGNGAPAKVELAQTYRLRPGDAHLYEPGDVHAPLRDGPTRLIRIEGQNTDKIERTKIEAA
ncbi:MAG: hypothetical protein JSU82_06225 [Rhodospirillales bacterium]|nr:MAG: hypothetical protein JSU82_06225 [Rhodospirillales bacterium]